MRTEELDYDLPQDLIATRPAPRRDEARLLVTGRGEGAGIEHRMVGELPRVLTRGDLLVFNTTRVVPARLVGVRRDTGGAVEGLFLHSAEESGRAGLRWSVLLRGKRLRTGGVVDLEGVEHEKGVSFVLEAPGQDGPGSWVVRVEGGETTERVLARYGRTPLPPYILGARKRMGLAVSDVEDRERYQTVYARAEESASVAAPTAGLHFTPELLSALDQTGVERSEVTLHVGMGTFKPVETETVEEHPMHAEWCRMAPETGAAVAACRARGGRVIAVGTTAARALESLSGLSAEDAARGAWTKLLITPGFEWKVVEGMMTNFHLPRSTLMAMVAAMAGSVERLKRIYAEAVRERYRFYSYGDAMLVTP